jgi:hypothetical protein
MTTYFDNKITVLRNLPPEQFEDFEQQIIQDVANVGELLRAEGGTVAFPEDLRDVAYQTLLRYSPVAWPCGLKYGGPDYEDVDAHRCGLSLMLEKLHNLFHAAHYRGWSGGDGILYPLRVANARMEERCVELALRAGAERATWLVEQENA